MDDADLDRLAELAACMVGSAAAELIARVLPRRDGEELPDLRNRMARTAMRLRAGPTIVATDTELPIATWLERLPIADRVLITLRYGEHLTPAEVARILDRQQSEIDSRLVGLLTELPEPAEAYLAFGLDHLAATAPGQADVNRAVTATAQRSSHRRRGTLALLGIALTFLVIAGMVGAVLDPAALGLVGWRPAHRVEPPEGWTVTRVELTLVNESTWLRRGAEECRFTLGGDVPFLQPDPIRSPGAERAVLVGGRHGWLVGDAHLEWSPNDSPATVSCEGPGEPDRLFDIAGSVRFERQQLRVPIGLPDPPQGVQEPTIMVEADGTTWLSVYRVYFSATFTPPARDGSCERTAPTSSAMAVGRDTTADLPIDRRLVATPTGSACAELRWRAGPDGPIRDVAERQLDELIRHVVVASDPADSATWFAAQDVLPPRPPR